MLRFRSWYLFKQVAAQWQSAHSFQGMVGVGGTAER